MRTCIIYVRAGLTARLCVCGVYVVCVYVRPSARGQELTRFNVTAKLSMTQV